MAHDALHLFFLERVGSDTALAPEVATLLRSHAAAARAGALLIDLPYFESFGSKVVGHFVHATEAPSPWGDRLHRGGSLAFLRALLDVARDQHDPRPTQALALGHLTHAVLDLETHPHVNRFVRTASQPAHGAHHLHRQIENVQLELWHRAARGAPLFGSSRLRVLATASTPFLATETLRGITAALRLATGDAPTAGTWRRWTLGLWQYAGLVSSPLSRFYFSERDVTELRPWFEGPELEFEGVWSGAVARAVSELNRAWELTRSSDGLDRQVFAQGFPEQNLDDPGAALEFP